METVALYTDKGNITISGNTIQFKPLNICHRPGCNNLALKKYCTSVCCRQTKKILLKLRITPLELAKAISIGMNKGEMAKYFNSSVETINKLIREYNLNYKRPYKRKQTILEGVKL